MDTSEETSDTCVDEHHDISSGPPSGPMEYFAATAGRTPTASRRSRSNHSPSKSPHSWSRRPGDKNLERATRYDELYPSMSIIGTSTLFSIIDPEILELMTKGKV